VVVVLVGELDPPQPIVKAEAPARIRPRQTADQIFRDASFLRRKNSGSRRKGKNISAVDVLVTVSAKTTVT